MREIHTELTTMDLSMIQELSDKLTRFELSFQSTRAKSCVRLVVEMFYYAVLILKCIGVSPEVCQCVPDRGVVFSEAVR